MSKGTGLAIDKSWAPVDERWVPDRDLGSTDSHDRSRMWHLDGVPWWEVRIPRRWHKCKPQTYAVLDWFTVVMRCGCGGISSGGRSPWLDRNSRTKR